MKLGLTAILVAATLSPFFASAPAVAGPYDAQWTRRCVSDNKDEGQTSATVLAYCKCMVDLMPERETRSVTAWEKTHKREENLCGAKAGWVGK